MCRDGLEECHRFPRQWGNMNEGQPVKGTAFERRAICSRSQLHPKGRAAGRGMTRRCITPNTEVAVKKLWIKGLSDGISCDCLGPKAYDRNDYPSQPHHQPLRQLEVLSSRTYDPIPSKGGAKGSWTFATRMTTVPKLYSRQCPNQKGKCAQRIESIPKRWSTSSHT